MNYTITENPYREGDVALTNGVGISSKAAKLNDDKKNNPVTKKEKLVMNWHALRPQKEEVVNTVSAPSHDYSNLLSKIGISVVDYGKGTISNNNGAKKLRVNGIVNTKAANVYYNSNKVAPIVEKVQEVKNVLPPKVEVESAVSQEDTRGRHERTGEIPVQDIQNMVQRETTPSTPVVATRTERNAMNFEVPKQEPKGGDVDLYNSLLHSNEQNDDVSKQLQGARNQLIIEQEENKKLAVQYGEAVRELEALKEEIANQRRIKEEQTQTELNKTLKEIATLKEENIAKTSDLTSIQAEIARLKAQRNEMEANMYDNRSMGRMA